MFRLRRALASAASWIGSVLFAWDPTTGSQEIFKNGFKKSYGERAPAGKNIS